MQNILDDLNPAQRAAVANTDGPQLVIAGAGSGKTRVLTYKIAYLLEQGVSAYNILALTFTNKAAREMRERIKKLVSNNDAHYLWMGTFHAICARILRSEATHIGYNHDFSIYDTADSKSVIKAIIKEMQIDDKVYKINAVMSRISWAKNNMYDFEQYSNNADIQEYDRLSRMPLLWKIYMEYQKRLRASNAMDFDDLLFNMNVLLSNHTDVRTKYQQGFRYILVDEYQDTNFAQYLIVRTLAEPQQNICVVGDDAQSIYSFRGADIQNILNFQKDYPNSQLYKLERNYRSTQTIVNAANSLIKKNINQIPKEVYSEKSVGDKILVESLDTDREEAKFLTQRAKNLRLSNYSYDQIAILYRTNAQSRAIEDEMRKQSVPYRIYGGLSFYQRKEIKDALAYIRLVNNLYDEESLLRIINFPKRSIGDTTMDKVVAMARQLNKPVFTLLANPIGFGVSISNATNNRIIKFHDMILHLQEQMSMSSATQMVDMILKVSGLMAEALTDKTADGTDRYQNLDELRNSVREFEQTRLQDGEQVVTLTDFLSEVSLATDQDKTEKNDTPRVTLMTVHSAKGLEFPIIMIAGMEDNLFPSAFAEEENNMEEERRLFYVAITRAMDQCIITYARSRFRNGNVNFSIPSRFLQEIDDAYLRKEENNHSATAFLSTSKPTNIDHNYSLPNHLQRLPKSNDSAREDITTPFEVGSRVCHNVFGQGTVLATYKENGNEKIEIQFDTFGKKTLLLLFAKLEKI